MIQIAQITTAEVLAFCRTVVGNPDRFTPGQRTLAWNTLKSHQGRPAIQSRQGTPRNGGRE